MEIRTEFSTASLDPDEPVIDEKKALVKLEKMPLYFLVKLERTRARPLSGLPQNVIPIQPRCFRHIIKVMDKDGRTSQKTVIRKQFPITPAYAFTDYRSQGQMLFYVIVDIATPPTGGLNLFNLYVALSRSGSRDSVRLLRDFDVKSLMGCHHPALVEEDERPETMNQQTLTWYKRMIDLGCMGHTGQ